MAYPRRQQPASGPRSGSPASQHSDLPPPRPFFLSEPNRTSSGSSLDISSLDPSSDSDSPAPPPRINTSTATTTRNGPTRRRSSERELASPRARRDSGTWSPSTLYAEPHSPQPHSPQPHSPPQSHQQLPTRPPPSSFTFPFQAYPGNPDPLPSKRRRASLDSTLAGEYAYASTSPGDSAVDLPKPFAPFMAAGGAAAGVGASEAAGGHGGGSTTSLLQHAHIPRSASNNSLYKASAAAAAASPFSPPASITGFEHQVHAPVPQSPSTAFAFASGASALPRNGSTPSFRAPFLAPSSRPTSSLWSPPSYGPGYTNTHLLSSSSPSASTTALAFLPGLTGPGMTGVGSGAGASPYALALPKARPPLPSTRLAQPLTKEDKPWLATREPRGRLSYCTTLLLLILGLAGAAYLCFSGIQEAQKQILDPNTLCLVLDDDFTGSDLDSGSWVKDVELGGFGVGEFEMSTGAADNLYTRGGELYFMPTLTPSNIVSAGNYTLPGCTSTNKTACSVTASPGGNGPNVVNPVMSARINTNGKKSVKFGKVEVRAKMPAGDWLSPAITLSPVNNTYGAAFPLSGAMTLVQARGNAPSYPAQGRNFVTASLVYGPLASVAERIFGWYSLKRSTFAAGFHVYTLEWTPTFIRMSVDARTHTMLLTTTASPKTSYWSRAHFPATAQNGSAVAVVQDIYSAAGGGNAAPFDQEFYLGIGLGVGGTSGWFPDNVGGKMWFDGSLTAMRDFARAQDVWFPTWPSSDADRALRIDYVKMWEVCK